MGWDVTFWNQTPFDLIELGYKEIKLNGRPRTLTDLLKRAKINAELNHFEKKFSDSVYQTYKFPPSKAGIKAKIKNAIVSRLSTTYRDEEGLQKLRVKLKESERKSEFYLNCKATLEREKPDLVFCTNQRPVNAIAPLTAAEDLGVSTATFIFSWDNLPKATMVVEPNYFLVWSEYMKQELLNYYPFIKTQNIFITGSPQFEPHFDHSLRMSREDFFAAYNLDPAKKYICFSGDDITTCPDDPHYLNDVAEAVEQLNKTGRHKLGIIFRRCPVDFSDRYDQVLKKYEELIVPISPEWKKAGEYWNAVLPTREDLKLQINTILHTKAVVNLASSMVFDYAVLDKPCLYLNYNVSEKLDESWSPQKVYNFVHFRSMLSGEEVFWLRSKEEISSKLELALKGAPAQVDAAKEWFKKINLTPAQHASERIWSSIEEITN